MRMKTAAIVLAAILACGGAWAARTEADRPGGMRTEAMDGRNAEDYMDASEEDFATFRDAMCYAFSESLVMMTQGADGVMAWYDPATAKRDCIHLSGGGTMELTDDQRGQVMRSFVQVPAVMATAFAVALGDDMCASALSHHTENDSVIVCAWVSLPTVGGEFVIDDPQRLQARRLLRERIAAHGADEAGWMKAWEDAGTSPEDVVDMVLHGNSENLDADGIVERGMELMARRDDGLDGRAEAATRKALSVASKALAAGIACLVAAFAIRTAGGRRRNDEEDGGNAAGEE